MVQIYTLDETWIFIDGANSLQQCIEEYNHKKNKFGYKYLHM